MLNSTLRIAAATAVLAAFPVAAQAAGAKTQTLRFYSVPQQIVMTQADGTVVDHAPYPEIAAGDTLDIYSQDFAGNHAHHAKRATGAEHAHCVFSAAPEPTCESHVALGGGLMVWNNDTLLAGSGRFFGATGHVLSNKEVGPDNASDVVARIHLK
jgi:hypothetical protein